MRRTFCRSWLRSQWGRVAVNTAGEPEVRGSLSVTASYFSVLGQAPALGRFFRPDEATYPSVRAVAVVSHRFWSERFAGSPEVLGATLRLNGVPVEVIGVAARGFTGHGPLVTDVYVSARAGHTGSALEQGTGRR